MVGSSINAPTSENEPGDTCASRPPWQPRAVRGPGATARNGGMQRAAGAAEQGMPGYSLGHRGQEQRHPGALEHRLAAGQRWTRAGRAGQAQEARSPGARGATRSQEETKAQEEPRRSREGANENAANVLDPEICQFFLIPNLIGKTLERNLSRKISLRRSIGNGQIHHLTIGYKLGFFQVDLFQGIGFANQIQSNNNLEK